MTDFRHHGDHLVHEGHAWNVVVGEYESPDGERFTRDVVRSPGAVAAVPVRRAADGTVTVVLVRQYRAPFNRPILEIPAGMRDIADEPTERTAERELVEEVGLRPGRLEHLTDFYPSVGMTDSILALYLATDLVEVGRQTHGPEEQHMEVVEMALSDALAMVDRGEIRDAKTIIGLLLTERRRRERGAL